MNDLNTTTKKNTFFRFFGNLFFLHILILMPFFSYGNNFYLENVKLIEHKISKELKPNKKQKNAEVLPDLETKTNANTVIVIAPGDVCNSLAATAIGGTVWEDWDYNGTMNENDMIGVSGIQVDLYDDCASIVETAVTDSDGNYIFSTLSAGTTYRIEFTLPASIAAWASPTQVGIDNGTTIQFVEPGNCANLGIASPSDYCGDDLVFLGTTCFVKKESDGSFSNVDVLVSFSNEMGGQAGDTSPAGFEDSGVETIALHNEVGSAFGLAYKRLTNELFAAAYMKYQADFGSGGPGAIYKVAVNPLTGEKTADAIIFTNLDTMSQLSICADPHGSDLDDPFNAPFEASAFNAVGKCGLGDLDISDDGSTLYVVNLTDKKIVAISSETGAYLTSWDFPTTVSSCTGNPDDIRPFGLKYYRGFLYTGSVCTGESTKSASDLQGFVHKLDLSTGIFSEVLDFPLDYDRVGNSGSESKFNFWITEIEDIDETGIGTAGSIQHYQPILSDIEFDGKKMIIGIRDRLNDQWGGMEETTFPPGTHPSLNEDAAISHGDLLIAYDIGTDNWVLENNGALPNGDMGAAQSANSGPGGFEFYADGVDTPSGQRTHLEISDGGLAVITNTGEVILSAMNPPNAVGVKQLATGGIVWMDNSDGTGQKALILYEGGFETFSKNNGVGDIETYCPLAPIEIGNYVWIDSDGDGIQDACESGLEGVIVALYDNTCTEIALDTTDVNGQYYFNDTNVTGGLTANESYLISFGVANQFNTTDATLFDSLSLTVANTGFGTNADLNDSDAIINDTGVGIGACTGGNPFIVATTGDAGYVNHGFDIGFAPQMCELVASSSQICQDNDTGGDSDDDYFVLDFDVTNSSSGASNMFEIVNTANSQTIGTGTYGTTLTIEWSDMAQTMRFAADNSSTYTLNVRDVDDNTCSETIITTTETSCSICSPEICLPVMVLVKKATGAD